MIRRKLYYDKLTGNILAHIPEQSNVVNVRETTIEEDFSTIKNLSERNEDSVGLLWLDYGQYSQDFAESNGYRVNPETKEIEFSYPDPNEEEPQEPVYQAPLSEEVKELKSRQDSTEDALLTLLMTM